MNRQDVAPALDPVELAQRAAAGDLAPEVVVWICTGLARHLAGEPLERALQLDRASRLRARNQALQEAAELLAPGAAPWPAAGRLVAAVRHYRNRIAPLLERDPARGLSPLDAVLHRAFKSGHRVPTTQNNLYLLLR